MGEAGRCMTHDLWATLNQRVVEFLDSRHAAKNWWTSSLPKGLTIEDKV